MNFFKFFTVWCLVFLVSVKSDRIGNITLDGYGLPRMFEMDDYSSCNEKYCRVDVRLIPQDAQSNIYKEIEESKQRYITRYNREYFHRMLCISKNITESKIWRETKNKIQGEFDPWKSTVEIMDIRCLKPFSIDSFTELDILLCVLLLAVTTIVFQSTLYDILQQAGKLHLVKDLPFIMSKEFENLFYALSVLKNLNRLKEKKVGADYSRLKSIQGIRFLNTILMIAFHTKNSYVFVYMDDVPKWEEILSHPLMFLALQAELLLVQIYFMISSFLLTNQILEIYLRNGKFTLYDVFVIFLNRMVRLTPPLVVMAVLGMSFSKMIKNAHIFDTVQIIHEGCLNSWWGTLCHVNFVLPFDKMCAPTTWYISLDTLFYLWTLLLMYVKLKLNLDLKKLLAILFVIFSGIYGRTIFRNGLDIMYKAYPQKFKDLFHAEDFNTLYVSPYANWNTSFVGVALGSIYFHTKNKSEKVLGTNVATKRLFYVTFITLPLATLFLTTVEWTPGWRRALIGPIIRPLYALGFGVGILGMSRGYGGIIKKFLENKHFLFYGDVTYCTYVFHFYIVFSKGIFNTELVPIRWFYLILWILIDVHVSFGLGLLSTILVEQPAVTLQKMYLPQVVKKPAGGQDVSGNKKNK